MEKQLKFAIVGCGAVASRHAREASIHGKLIAVNDIVPEKADALARQYNANAYYTIEELLSSSPLPDVVAVCTPNALHPLHSIKALQAGCHVICEKPMSITSNDAKQMIEAAHKSGKKLFVVKSARFNPSVLFLRDLLEKNSLGKIYSFQLNCFWNRPPEYYLGTWRGTQLDGGTLFTQFSHYIDSLLWLFGNWNVVYGIRKNLAHQQIIQSEDTGIVVVETEKGIPGGIHWSVNAYRKNMEVSLSVLGEKGTIQLGGAYMEKIKYGEAENITFPEVDSGSPNDYGLYQGSMSHHHKVYENVVRDLNNETQQTLLAEDGLKTVEAIEKIYRCISLT
ncbi:MAG: Gfo/Idh/MocA family oxidoreductase [Chitinophagaceae bacterium]|nr:Gfo/Idh/MocA family oxidoreductase [Chitinophagaceae bacterium]